MSNFHVVTKLTYENFNKKMIGLGWETPSRRRAWSFLIHYEKTIVFFEKTAKQLRS
jgi:hypothetical protein